MKIAGSSPVLVDFDLLVLCFPFFPYVLYVRCVLYEEHLLRPFLTGKFDYVFSPAMSLKSRFFLKSVDSGVNIIADKICYLAATFIPTSTWIFALGIRDTT